MAFTNAESLEKLIDTACQIHEYMTLHHLMKDCLQDNKAHYHLDHFM